MGSSSRQGARSASSAARLALGSRGGRGTPSSVIPAFSIAHTCTLALQGRRIHPRVDRHLPHGRLQRDRLLDEQVASAKPSSVSSTPEERRPCGSRIQLTCTSALHLNRHGLCLDSPQAHAWNSLTTLDQPKMSRAFQMLTRCELWGHRNGTSAVGIPLSRSRCD